MTVTHMEHCPNCNELITWEMAGRFLLPTEDGQTNHFHNCTVLRAYIQNPHKGRHKPEIKVNQ